jgi:hypothetical protein
VLAWNDVYHEGPVPAGPRDALLDARASFLASCGYGDAATIRRSLVARDDALCDAVAAGDDVVLWFEHDLYDQLQLLDALALIARTIGGGGRIELIEVGSFPGRPRFRGLGELTPGELATLWPRRRAVGEAELEDAVIAWESVRASEPTALDELRRRPQRSRPFLAAAIERFLEELPAVRGGLSRTERQLLGALRAGPRTRPELFEATQELEQTPFHGDTWLFRALDGLAVGRRALVARDGERWSLTRAGRAVLGGRGDRVELAGIDRWLGGTHLRGESVWRWDAGAREVVAPA